MKKMVLAVLAVGALMTAIAFASITAEDWNFGGLVNFDNGCIWKIKGTTVTATADNLNSGLASATASLVSNAVLKVYGSNLVIKAGGTVTVPAGSVGSAALAYTAPYTTNVLAGAATVTNSIVLDAKGLVVTLTHNP